MKHRFTACLIVFSCLLASALSASTCVLGFTARQPSGSDYAEVVGAGRVIMRLRGGSPADLLARAVAAAERLNEAALAGASAGSVQVRPAGADAHLFVGNQRIVAIDATLARLSGSTPTGLANTWAATLKDIFGRRYLIVEPADELTVPVGEMRRVRYGGSAGAPDAVVSDAPTVASVRMAPGEKSIEISALTPGDATLVIRRGECVHRIRLICRKWAARISPETSVQISGLKLRNDELLNAVTWAARGATVQEPGARVLAQAPVSAGAGYAVHISASGPDYLSVSRRVQVNIQRVEPPHHVSPLLLVSNLPEKITEPAVLMRERISGGVSTRVLWHHINLASRPLRMSIRVHNISQSEARFHLTQASAGPNPDEIFAGHSAAARYLRDLFEGTGYVVRMPSGTSLDIASVALGYRDVGSGVGRIAPLMNADLVVELVVDELSAPGAYFTPVPSGYYHDAQTSGFVFEGQRAVQMRHVVGQEWTFHSLGKAVDVNSRGQELAGSYGVLHEIMAVVENPTDMPATCEFAVRARGGVARATFWLGNSLIETPMLSAANEQIIYRATVEPRGTHRILLRTMPESGSNYPVLLTLRSTQR